MNPSNLENERFPLKAYLLSRRFETGNVETKAETIERHMRGHLRAMQQALIENNLLEFLSCMGA